MVVVGVYCQGCDVRASVATVYVTFIEWGQGGVGHSGAHQLNLRPTLVTLRVPLAHAITKHHQPPLCQQGGERESFTTFVVSTWLGLKLGRSELRFWWCIIGRVSGFVIYGSFGRLLCFALLSKAALFSNATLPPTGYTARELLVRDGFQILGQC